VRLDVRRIGPLKNGDQVVGNRTRVKVVENKLAAPFQEAELDIRYGRGICASGDLLDLAAARGIVERSGAYYAYQGERLGQGRERARELVESSPALQEALRAAVLTKVAAPAGEVAEAEPAEDEGEAAA
jgi:recombination protein RecA